MVCHIRKFAPKHIYIIHRAKGILKQENISDDTSAVIKEFLDDIKQDDVGVDLTNVLLGLKGLGMPIDELAKSVQEVEVNNDPEEIPSMALGFMRKIAEAYLGCSQPQATKDAGKYLFPSDSNWILWGIIYCAYLWGIICAKNRKEIYN